MKKILSLIIALTLALSTAAVPVAYAATPAKSTAKTTATNAIPAPTPAQVQSLYTNYMNALYNTDKKLADECIVLNTINIQAQDSALAMYTKIKNDNFNYAFLNKVDNVKSIPYSQSKNTYLYNFSFTSFIAVDNVYVLGKETIDMLIVYDTPSKKYKLLSAAKSKGELLYDVRTSPYFKEILKTVESFGPEYVNWVKEGKQPEIKAPDSSNPSYEDTIAHKLNTDQTVIPVQLENVQRVSNTLIVNTKNGQKASITIDLKDHIGEFYSLDIYPELTKAMKNVTLDISANGIPTDSYKLNQSGITYELLEDNLVKLEFNASEPFIIQGLYLINN